MKSRKLRCLGGLNHGQIVHFEDSQREITLATKEPTTNLRVSGLGATSHEIKQTKYTLRELTCNGQPLEFLAPDGWTDHDALRTVIER